MNRSDKAALYAFAVVLGLALAGLLAAWYGLL